MANECGKNGLVQEAAADVLRDDLDSGVVV